MENENQNHSKRNNLIEYLIIGAVAIVLVGFVLWYWEFHKHRMLSDFPDWAQRGQYGDSFGAANALFSALAFVALIIAILLQKRELELQREELQDTRKQLADSARAQEYSLKLTAMNSLIQAYGQELSTFPERDQGTWGYVTLVAEQRRLVDALKAMLRVSDYEVLENVAKELSEELDEEFVIECFRKIPEFADGNLKTNRSPLGQLVTRGIDTRKRLSDFVADAQIFDTIRKLYHEELLRDEGHNLDFDGAIIWGSIFFKNGLSSQLIEKVRQRLRETAEYKEKHKPSTWEQEGDKGE